MKENLQAFAEKESGFKSGFKYVWNSRFSKKILTEQEIQLVASFKSDNVTTGIQEVAEVISNYKPSLGKPEHVTWLEEHIGMRAVDKVAKCLFENIEGEDSFNQTLASLEKYESFSIEELYYDAEPVLYINFPGWGLGDTPRDPLKDQILAALPKGGITINVTGPGSITSIHPDQLISANERVFAELDKIVEKYPNYKIRGFLQSAGTQFSWIMNEYSKRYPERVDKVVAISTGTSIGDGQFMTPVTARIADICRNQGYSKESYTDAISKYTQKENLLHLANLPEGSVMYISGTNDCFVPFHAEGGTNDLIKIGERYGLTVDSIELNGLDHVTVVLFLMKELALGRNVFKLNQKIEKQLFDELPEHVRKALIEHKGSGTFDSPNQNIDEFINLLVAQGANIYELLSPQHPLNKFRVHSQVGKAVESEGKASSLQRTPYVVLSSNTFSQTDNDYLDRMTQLILDSQNQDLAVA